MLEDITIGLFEEEVTVITQDLTALSVGSGSVDVYATPAMIALMESAAVKALDSRLPDGYASVGIHIDIEHIAATPVGEEVRAIAEVIGVDDRRVKFLVRAWDEKELIGEGTHTRFIINLERFLNRLSSDRGDRGDRGE